ncbi:MAG: hypothetical protein ACLUOO_10465 [Coprococcus sp.]
MLVWMQRYITRQSETPLANHMWGTYSDSDAKLWNDGTTFEDGEGYIKFWAVRKQDDQDEVVDCQALPYMYDTTIPDAFSVEKSESMTRILI